MTGIQKWHPDETTRGGGETTSLTTDTRAGDEMTRPVGDDSTINIGLVTSWLV